MPFAATWMDLEIITLSEISQRKTNTIRYHLYVKSKTMIQINISMKQKQIHSYREHNCGCQGGLRVGEGWNGNLANYYIQDG